MADKAIPITAGSGTNIDSQQPGGSSGNLRQTITIGDALATTGVAPVDATLGLAVQVTNGPISVTESGAWGVTATIGNVVNALATVTPLGVYNPIIPSLASLAAGAFQDLQLDQRANLLTNLATVSAPIPVNASVQGTIPVSGSVTATIGNVVNALASIQGQIPVTASVIGVPNVFVASGATISIAAMPAISVTATNTTIFQGGAPWLVNASLVGQPAVTASIVGVPNVSATIGVPNVIASILGLPIGVTATYAAPWNVVASQGATPWLVNSSIVGLPIGVTATYAAPWNVTATVTVAAAVTVGAANLSPTSVGGWKSYMASVVGSVVTISAAAGKFGGYMVINNNTTPAYIEIFDLTAVVTLGVNVPTMIFPLPGATIGTGIAANLELSNGANLANGLKMGVVTQIGTASVVATGITGTIWYV